jgi:hypothetical protein
LKIKQNPCLEFTGRQQRQDLSKYENEYTIKFQDGKFKTG